MTRNRIKIWIPIVVLALSAVGLAVSVLSTADHLKFRQLGGTEGGVCSILIESGCAAAHSSKNAELLGIPISHLGTGFYFAFAVLAVWALRRRRFVTGFPPLVTILGLFAVAYSVFLATILIRSGEPCPLCIALYVVNAGLLVTGLIGWLGGVRRPGLHDLAPGFALTVTAGLILLAVTTPFLLRKLNTAAETGPLAGASNLGNQPLPSLALPTRIASTGISTAEDDIVEFSDLDCPHCANLHRTITGLADERGPADIRVRFVNFPLDPACNPDVGRAIHPTACQSARAGICAQEQNKFWQFADVIYALTGPRTPEVLLNVARTTGLDTNIFTECLSAERTNQALAEDISLAHKSGVKATPTILINGWTFEGALSRERLVRILDDTIPCGCDRHVSDGICDGVEPPALPSI